MVDEFVAHLLATPRAGIKSSGRRLYHFLLVLTGQGPDEAEASSRNNLDESTG